MPPDSEDNDGASAPRAVAPPAIASGSPDGLLDAIIALQLAGPGGDTLFGLVGSIPGHAEKPLPPALRTLSVLSGRELEAWTFDDWRLAATALAYQAGVSSARERAAPTAPASRRRGRPPTKPDPRAMDQFRPQRPAGRPRLLTDDERAALVYCVDLLRASGGLPDSDTGVLRQIFRRQWEEEGRPGREAAFIKNGLARWKPYLSRARGKVAK